MSEKNNIFKRVLNSAVIKNPLLFEAVGLCPVVAITLSLKLAVFLAVVTAIELIVCELLTSLLLKNIRRYWRVLLYVVFGVGVIFPIMILVNRFFPNLSINFGVYLPLMAVNALIALHCERVAVKDDVKSSLVDALAASMSYGAVAIITGLIREVLAKGSIGDISLGLDITFPALLTPFGGFLIIGFFAAIFKAVINAKYPDASPDRAFDTSEVTRSVRGTFKELMRDELDPYSFGTESAFSRIRKEKKAEKSAQSPVEKTQEVNLEKPETVKKEEAKKEKIKKTKKSNKLQAAPQREPRVQRGERTYLDDFSDMLSELEEYKNRPEESKTEEKEGDGQ